MRGGLYETRVRQMATRVVATLVAATIASGCFIFRGSAYGGDGAYGEAYPSAGVVRPREAVTYRTGRATLTFTGGTVAEVVLDELAPGPHRSDLGVTLYWRNEDGYGLHLMQYEFDDEPVDGGIPPGGRPAEVAVHRIATSHWVTPTGRCLAFVRESGPDRISGTASCTSVRWVDAVLLHNAANPEPSIEGEGPFDVRITFEATR